MDNAKTFESSKSFTNRNPYNYLYNVLNNISARDKTYNSSSLLASKNTAWQIILLQESPE